MNRTIQNSLLGGAAGVVTYFLGGWDIVLQVLVTLIVLDYVTGVIAGYIQKELSSKTGFIGIVKKVSILILVTVAVTVDRLAGTDMIRVATCLFFIGNEGISVLENCAGIGIQIPEKLLLALKQLKSEGDTDE